MLQQTTHLPVVPTEQNGTGIAATTVQQFDEKGRLIWTRDELGIITYRQYDVVTGLLVREIQDANTMQVADFTVSVPAGWSTISGAGKHLVTDFAYDFQGRVIQTLGPRNTVVNDSNQNITVRPATWTVYDDARFTVRSASGFATMSGNTISGFTLTNPVSITIFNTEGSVLEQIQATRASTSGRLLASDLFPQSSYIAWTKNMYQGGRLVATRQYHQIPVSGDGTKNLHFLETTFGHDAFGRQNRTTSPDGTITHVDLDRKGNAIKTWIGTTNANLVVVEETEYGDTGVCAGCTGQRDKPRVTVQHVDANTMRITEYGYDWRGRQILVFGEEDSSGNITYAKQTYDNLNRGIIFERFLLTENTGTAQPTGQERAVVLQNNLADDRLLARTENFYDARGQVWKTEQSVVNPATGTVQGKLLGQSWHDVAGRVIRQVEPGANHQTEHVYDSLGRVQRSLVTIGGTVFTQSEMSYDNLGNAILQTQIERLSSATGTGALTSTTGRFQSTASWFDGAGRILATVNCGTNGGTALTRPATVPARSDNVLVTEIRYDSATGRAFRTIDPAGKEHRTFVDALGRTVRTVTNFTGTGAVSANTPDENVTVEMTYHPSGQAATLIARNPVTGDQVTRYVYGTVKAWATPLIHRNDWLVAEIYPDSDNFENASGVLQNGTSGVIDRVEFLYNRLGEVIAKRDQNGTVHTYEYDNLGRLLHDRVTTLASGVDGAVRRISTVYDVVGNVRSVTSFGENNNVVNEVLHEYDANGLLVRDFSNPNGAVAVASTPHIGYTYDATKSGEYFTKRLRSETMKYPSGKTLSYDYDAASNVSAIKEGNTPLVSYTYSGSGSVMQTTYNEPDISLNYDNGGVEQEIVNAPALLGTILYQIRGTADGFSEGIARDDATFIANIANSEPVTITSTQAGKHYGILVSFGGTPTASPDNSLQWSGARKGVVRFAYRTSNVQTHGTGATCAYKHEFYNNRNEGFAHAYFGQNGSLTPFAPDTGGEWQTIEREFGDALPIHSLFCYIEFRNVTGTLEIKDFEVVYESPIDRFGRIVEHAWKKGTAELARIVHGYDRASNRTYRHDSVRLANSEAYGYDGVNQVKSLNRGLLNADRTGVTTPNFTEAWNYDSTGNWQQYNRHGAVENRTHNAANEILTNAAHDRNGNMTLMPGLRGRYDAWNRLVEVRNPSDVLIARYDYDGFHGRVKKTVGNVVTTSFYNAWWQELESTTSGQTTSYVWGVRYIDDLVLRERGNERLYSIADANWNVVAIANASGIIQERMRYDAFGRITWLNAAFAVKGNSDFGWNRTFTGQVLDAETGMMVYRNRFYHTGLGRFVHRDPIEYLAGDANLYRYVWNNSLQFVDPDGLRMPGRSAPGGSRLPPGFRTLNDLPWMRDPTHPPMFPTPPPFPRNPPIPLPPAPAAPRYPVPILPPRPGSYRPPGKLPWMDGRGPIPSSNTPHTQLGTGGSKPGYTQAREFGAGGRPIRDIDYTDHGRPNHHNPHYHPWIPSPTGGTPIRDSRSIPFCPPD